MKFDPAWQEQLDGINQGAVENDHYLILAAHDEAQFTDAAFMPKMLREPLVDGVLLPHSSCVQTELETAARKYGIPTVWLMKNRVEDSVYCDVAAPMHALVEQFAAHGHKHAALVGGSDTSQYVEAFRAAGAEKSVRTTVLSLECAEVRERAEEKKIWELLNREDRPTAVIATHGVLALRLSSLALRWSLKIPEDLSVTGLLSELDSLRFSQTMAYWSNPNREVGEKSVAMLLKKMSSGNAPVPSEILLGKFNPGSSLSHAPLQLRQPHQ
jgi:DNA-binding LacI/PurR family transcriptional regulator